MVVVTAAAIALFAVPLAVVTAASFRSREVSDLQQAATRVLLALPDTGLEGGDPFQLPAPLGDEYSAVYDSTRALVNGVGPSGADRVVLRALAGDVADAHISDELVVAVPILDENQVIGVVRVAEPWSVVARATQRSWTLMTLGGLGAIAAAAALAAALSRRLVAPVDELVDVAVRLGDGDFTARVVPAGVTELDRAGIALNSTASRLAAVLGRERAFAADVSHQLSTPLTSLRLELESALLDPDRERNEVLERGLEEVDRLQATIETLLAVARDLPVDGGDTDLAELCTGLRESFEGRLAALHRSLVVDIEADIPRVRCPAQVLREILVVLVDNAIEHGGGMVDVSVRRRGTGVTIAVGDEGPGVPPERVDRIFGRRDSGATGNGIGLSLVRSLAEAHELRVELTRPGQAPVFTVACPGVIGRGEPIASDAVVRS